MKIGVTGISGYLGSAVGKCLVDKGKYFVRGSVRSLQEEHKIAPLRTAYQANVAGYELVETDLLNTDSIYKFVEGLDYIIHVATPFPDASKNKNEAEVLDHAIDGTLDLLKASHELGVKRVVVTASTATINDPQGSKLVYDHNDRVDPDTAQNVFAKSKIIAEQQAWNYIEEIKQKDEISLELVTMHPSGLIGPTLTKQIEFTSMKFMTELCEGKMTMLPKFSMGVSDVRDVAEAHYKALYGKPYQRYVVVSDSLFLIEISKIIKEEFGQRGLNPTLKEMPYIYAKLQSFVNPFMNTNMPRWGKKIKFDSSLAMQELDYKPTDVRKSIIDMIESGIQQGYIKAKK